MTNKFLQAVEIVLKHEGGLVDHPNDPGGITNYGISLRSYPELGPEGIRNLTKKQAIDIYHRDWWDRFRYDTIRDLRVAGKVFDLAVNMGPRPAHRILQSALNHLGHDLVVDGLLGPLTFSATNQTDAEKLQEAICFFAAEHYYRLARNRRPLRTFLLGWLNRAYHRL